MSDPFRANRAWPLFVQIVIKIPHLFIIGVFHLQNSLKFIGKIRQGIAHKPGAEMNGKHIHFAVPLKRDRRQAYH